MLSPLSPVVWIVDDDPDDQYLFELAFRTLKPPVQVKLLSDGEDLLPALQESDRLPSLIVLDLNMPRVDGFEALKQLRMSAIYKKLPVVVLTTSTRYEDREKAFNLGANEFLTKPTASGKLIMLFAQLVKDWR